MGNRDNIEKTHNARYSEDRAKAVGTSTVQQLALTAAGAAGSALLGAILARRGYTPKTVSGAIAALGAGLASVGDSHALRAFGAGAMSGSGAQLVLMLFAEHEQERNVINATDAVTFGEIAPVSLDAANANIVSPAAKAAAS